MFKSKIFRAMPNNFNKVIVDIQASFTTITPFNSLQKCYNNQKYYFRLIIKLSQLNQRTIPYKFEN